jgi:hypothetical protein
LPLKIGHNSGTKRNPKGKTKEKGRQHGDCQRSGES